MPNFTVIIPSSKKIEPSEKSMFSRWCISRGLDFLSTRDESFKDYYGDCGAPEERADLIIELLRNEDVKYIFMQGGSGADEVVECLKKRESEITPRNIPLIGFSDATQIQQYLAALGAVRAVQGAYGPLSAEEDINCARDNLEKALADGIILEGQFKGRVRNLEMSANFSKKMDSFLRDEEITEPLLALNSKARMAGEIDGKLVVYNDHSLRTSYGAVTDPEYHPILLIEAGFRGESVKEGFARARAWMLSCGGEKNFQAIIISKSDGKCFGEKALESCDLSEVMLGVGDMEIPVFFGAPFGHGGIDLAPLPLNTATKITVDDEGLATLNVTASRSSEDIMSLRTIYDKGKLSRAAEPKTAASYDGEAEKIFQKVAFVNLDPARPFVEGKHDFLSCALQRHRRGHDIPALIDEDLRGKNIMIGMSLPSEEEFRIYDAKGDYQMAKLMIAKQAIQLSLMELVKAEKLQNAAAIMIVSDQELPEGFLKWFNDFGKRHELKANLLMACVPDFPKDKLSDVVANKIKLTMISRETEAYIADRFPGMP